MADIVDEFEKYANILGWQFSYGDQQNRNLLESDRDVGKIYMLLDPVTRGRAFSVNGGEGLQSFSGSFMLVVKSDLDQVYHLQDNAGDVAQSRDFINRFSKLCGSTIYDNPCVPLVRALGKYTENIQPLLNDDVRYLEDFINCSDYTITGWSIIDVINALDANTDGIIVTYTLNVL
jgi:hypothetical protein